MYLLIYSYTQHFSRSLITNHHCISKVYLHIYFLFPDAPQLNLRLGGALKSELIKEGDDVYFECGVDSNPAIARLEWYKGVSVKYLN